MFQNVILSGGSSLFPGMEDRLYKELFYLAPPSTTVKVKTPTDRKYSAWKGGSIMAEFTSMLISKAEYNEIGTAIVHRRCF
uniref:Uncharacterized protein n=1 Tax=Arcella intermedia TaxID=1963864 RepID=A0A6B2LVC3_9EUKA